MKKYNAYILASIIAIVFSLVNVYIYLYQHALGKLASSKIIYGISAVIIFVLVWIVVIKLLKKDSIQLCVDDKKNTNSAKYFMIVWLLHFILWFPVFLAYYPGVYTYDVYWQMLQQVIGYSTHYPLVHTLFLQFFYSIVGEQWLHSYNMGVALSTIIQMLLISGMISYMYLFLYQMNVRKEIRRILLIVTCLFPVFPILAISATKDGLFFGFFGMLISSLGYESMDAEYFEQRRRVQIIYVISIIGVVIFRNNGIYPVVVVAILFGIRTIRTKQRYRFMLTLVGLLIGVFITHGLQIALGASKGSFNEALSVPYQQIAGAYVEQENNMSDQEKDEILQLIPDAKYYLPRISDVVKNSAEGDKNLSGLIKLYWKIGKQYPKSYIKAFIKLDAGYLGITDTSYANIYEVDELKGVLPTAIVSDMGVYRESLLPGLQKKYDSLFVENNYENVFGLWFFMSPALYFWIAVVVMAYGFFHKKRQAYVVILFLAVYMLTILAGPCVLVRYAMPYVISVPILITAVLCERQRK